MNYIGIDPGLKGAIAAISEDGKVLWIDDLPKWLCMYPARIVEALADGSEYKVAHEDVHGRPGQSCVANTTFMKAAGSSEILGRTYAKTLDDFILVAPQTWKKHFGLISKGLTKTERKKLSIDLARKLFPDVADQLTASKDGRAEALLIAEYCRNVDAGVVQKTTAVSGAGKQDVS